MILNLDPNFKPLSGTEVSYESFFFKGGEPHIRIDSFDIKKDVYVTHRIQSFNDLGLLAVTVDALRRMGVNKVHTLLPYFPGARQDRVMLPGESLTVKVVADFINQLELTSITIFDPHSDVTPALLNRCTVISNHAFISQIVPLIPNDFVLISPDAGASKKVFKLASQLGHSHVLECGKKRDLATGKLSGFVVPTDNINGKPCLLVDDICDGGGTFIGLGEELKRKNAGPLYLAISHGIFSKGFDELGKIYTEIFTTDSFRTIEEENTKQIKLNQFIN